jgi:hypothetical protein
MIITSNSSSCIITLHTVYARHDRHSTGPCLPDIQSTYYCTNSAYSSSSHEQGPDNDLPSFIGEWDYARLHERHRWAGMVQSPQAEGALHPNASTTRPRCSGCAALEIVQQRRIPSPAQETSLLLLPISKLSGLLLPPKVFYTNIITYISSGHLPS